MKRVLLRTAVCLLTFALGVMVTALFLIKRHASIPQSQGNSECSVAFNPAQKIEKMRQGDDPFLFSAFQQTPVYQMPDCVDEAYSLTWIPSFHPPVLVEIWHSSNKAFLVAKQLDRRFDGSSKETNSRALTEFEWRDFVNLIDHTSFWQLPSTADEVLLEDGAAWIVDGLRSKKYHWVRRRVPDEHYAKICKHLIRLSGLQTAHDLYLP